MLFDATRPWRTGAVPLLALFSLALANCSGSNSDQTVVLALSTNEPCYGVQIDVETDGPADGISCTPDADLDALGCDVDTDTIGDSLSFSVRGCFAPGGTALFTCTASAGIVTRIRDSSELNCGCGCAEECPDDPELVVCDANDLGCQAAAAAQGEASAEEAVVADRAPERTISTAGGVATTSSTLFCGTCCDVLSDPDVNLPAMSSDLHELEFEISLPQDDPQCPDIGDCSIAAAFNGPSRQVSLAHNRLRVCVSSPTALEGQSRLVASCDVQSGGDDQFTFSNVKALDENLRPIDPPPALFLTDTF